MSRLTILNVAYPFAPVSDDAVGGAEQVLACLDRAIAEEGHGSLVVAADGSRARGALFTQPLPARIDARARREVHARCAAVIARVVGTVRVDVIHLHGVDFLGYLPPPGPSVVVTLHLPPSWYAPEVFRLTRPRTQLVCVSRSQRAECPPTASVRVIPNGVRLDAFTPRAEKEGYALVLGRVCPEKGIHLALEAARVADVDLVIAGEVFPYEEHEQYFDERVRPLLDARRRFVGPVGLVAKRELLARARCLLVPSLAHETSSLVAMEALASGTPVVAFRAGALPDIVEHERTGLLVADVDEMAAAIPRARALSAVACRRAAEERFDARAMCSRYLSLYAEAATARAVEARA